jgi:hypothetical protein
VAQALPFPLFDHQIVSSSPAGGPFDTALSDKLDEMSQQGWAFAAALPDGRILMQRPRHVAVIMFEIPVIPVSGVLHRAG